MNRTAYYVVAMVMMLQAGCICLKSDDAFGKCTKAYLYPIVEVETNDLADTVEQLVESALTELQFTKMSNGWWNLQQNILVVPEWHPENRLKAQPQFCGSGSATAESFSKSFQAILESLVSDAGLSPVVSVTEEIVLH